MQASTSMRTLLWACALLALAAVPTQAQTTIEDITSNPGRYSDQVVQVSGTVGRHVDSGNGSSGTQNYILEDDAGGSIRVKTTEQPPGIDSRVDVEGLVQISAINRTPVIIERGRSVSASQASGNGSGQSQSSADALRENFSTTTVFLIFGLGILVIAALAYFTYASEQQPASAPSTSSSDDEMEASEAPAEPSLSDTELGGEDEDDPFGDEHRIKSESSTSTAPEEESDGPDTLKFKAPPKTMKFIPGKLVIAAGPDQGKEFRIAGRPTPEGNVVTIGRAEVEGERAFAHIQLGDTYRTVSRMQAEIIQGDEDILLKNKSTTNPTMVNGDEVPADTTVSLEDGDIIRMGELMLRYETE
jgi:hypothetical protein